MEIVGDIEKPLWTDDQWREFERQRRAQAQAWEREWRRYGTISGRKTVGQPRHLRRKGQERRLCRRPRR
jgi:hypothetical protein